MSDHNRNPNGKGVDRRPQTTHPECSALNIASTSLAFVSEGAWCDPAMERCCDADGGKEYAHSRHESRQHLDGGRAAPPDSAEAPQGNDAGQSIALDGL
jgi:hypothetical protein